MAYLDCVAANGVSRQIVQQQLIRQLRINTVLATVFVSINSLAAINAFNQFDSQ